jgi:hypothetical protein
MLSFNQFISEEIENNIKIVSISEEVIDKIDEINDILDNSLTESLVNPYIGWVNSSKILSGYGIDLPKVSFRDIQEGEEVVALSINESEYYFYYGYLMNEDGSYESFATITDEKGLDDLLED